MDCSTAEEAPRLVTTVAEPMIVTINIAYKLVGEDASMNGEYPEVGQRRVDAVFVNQHVVTTQVRSVFCVLCAELCVLPLAT